LLIAIAISIDGSSVRCHLTPRHDAVAVDVVDAEVVIGAAPFASRDDAVAIHVHLVEADPRRARLRQDRSRAQRADRRERHQQTGT